MSLEVGSNESKINGKKLETKNAIAAVAAACALLSGSADASPTVLGTNPRGIVLPINSGGPTNLATFTVESDGDPVDFNFDLTLDEIGSKKCLNLVDRILGAVGQICEGNSYFGMDPGVYDMWLSSNDWYGQLTINKSTPPSPIPEPGTGTLFALGLAGLAVSRRGEGKK